MATKIINVLRDDSLEEILDIFNKTPAKEVIFVLPKNCQAFRKEEDFETLSREASNQNKNISLLCSNPSTNKLARKYDFDVLLAKDSGAGHIKTVNQLEEAPWGDSELPGLPVEEKRPLKSAPKSNPKKVEEEEEQEEDEEKETEEEEKEDEEPEYKVIRAVKIRRMEDVIPPEEKQSRIKITPKKEKVSEIEVTNEFPDKGLEPEPANFGIWSDWKSAGREKKEKKISRPKVSLPRLNSRMVAMSLAVIAIILLGTVLFISTGSAKITIKPKKDDVDLTLKVSASDRFASIDANFNTIPGQVFTIEKSLTQKFPATGSKEAIQKARGKITIYNELASPQPLVATTRFESEPQTGQAGLVFRTLKTITVPAAKPTGPGTVEVEIIADKPGQEYNISAGKFVIVAFREKNDTEKYQKIYAKSAEPMHGGINGKATVVSESDYNSAKETLSVQLAKDVAEALKSQASQLKVVNADNIAFGDPKSTAEPDDAATEFTMSMTASIKAVGLKEEDLYKLINEHLQNTKNVEVIPSKVELSYNNIKLNSPDNVLDFDLKIKGNGYSRIDQEQMTNDLLGMSSKEIRSYFESKQNIESAKVMLSPFWTQRVPREKGNIKYEIVY